MELELWQHILGSFKNPRKKPNKTIFVIRNRAGENMQMLSGKSSWGRIGDAKSALLHHVSEVVRNKFNKYVASKIIKEWVYEILNSGDLKIVEL